LCGNLLWAEFPLRVENSTRSGNSFEKIPLPSGISTQRVEFPLSEDTLMGFRCFPFWVPWPWWCAAVTAWFLRRNGWCLMVLTPLKSLAFTLYIYVKTLHSRKIMFSGVLMQPVLIIIILHQFLVSDAQPDSSEKLSPHFTRLATCPFFWQKAENSFQNHCQSTAFYLTK